MVHSELWDFTLGHLHSIDNLDNSYFLYLCISLLKWASGTGFSIKNSSRFPSWMDPSRIMSERLNILSKTKRYKWTPKLFITLLNRYLLSASTSLELNPENHVNHEYRFQVISYLPQILFAKLSLNFMKPAIFNSSFFSPTILFYYFTQFTFITRLRKFHLKGIHNLL